MTAIKKIEQCRTAVVFEIYATSFSRQLFRRNNATTTQIRATVKAATLIIVAESSYSGFLVEP